MRVHNLSVDTETVKELLFEVEKSKRGEIMVKGRKKKNVSRKKAPAEIKCDEEHAFRCVDGAVYHSINELADALETMSDDSFYYHANDSKNDFASWISGVFTLDNVSEKLRNAKTREKSQIILLKYLAGN